MYQFTYFCQNDNHSNEPVVGYCFNQKCFYHPQFCVQCQKQKHNTHNDDCKSLEQIRQMIPQITTILRNSEQKVEETVKTTMKQYQDILKLLVKEKKQMIELENQINEQNYLEFNKGFDCLKQWGTKMKDLDYLINVEMVAVQTSINDLYEAFQDLIKNEIISIVVNQQQSSIIIDQPKRQEGQNFNAYKINLDKANQLIDQNDFESALKVLNEAIQLNPKDPQAYKQKGWILNSLNRFNEALLTINQVIQQNPSDYTLFILKGWTLHNLNRYQEALDCYEKAINLDKHPSCALINKGNVLHSQKQYEQALECYNQAIKFNANQTVVYCNKGNTLHNLNRFEEALESFDQALSLDDQNYLAYFGKGIQKIIFFGNTLLQLNHSEEAIIYLDKCLSINKNYKFAQELKGQALMSFQKFPETLKL